MDREVLPEVLVVVAGQREDVSARLARAQVPFRCVTAAEALRAGRKDAQLVMDRAPGWEALVAAFSPDGAVVLLGEGPSPEERRRLKDADLEIAWSPREVVDALARADGRARVRRGRAAPERLQERADAVALVNEFAQAIARQGDLTPIIAETIARTRELCAADGASLLLVDPATGELYFEAVAGEQSQGVRQVRLKPGQGIAGRVARDATPLAVSDVTQDASFDARCDAATGFSTGSVIAVPLLVGGDLLGVLEAVRGAGKPPLGDAELKRLVLLAPHVAIAVHNGQITAELRRTQAQVLKANGDLEAKVAERTQQIATAKREWEKTFDAISEPIAMQDGFVVRRANLAYARKVGVRVQDVPGKTCHELTAGRASPCPGCPIAQGMPSEPRSSEVQLGQSAFDVSAFRVEDAASNGVVLHYRDVTHERILEDRLRETERLAAVGQLASGAAHEINNPLGFLSSNLQSLSGNLSELKDALKSLPPGMPELIEDCSDMVRESLDGAKRVAEIVRGLRELSRLEISGGGRTRVNDCVTRAVRAELSGDARVTVDVPEELEVSADPLKLDHALVHILRNAKQAIRADGRIRVRAWKADGEVRLQIEDDGPGIAREHLRRVFEPFFSTRGVGKGIGLGLTAAWGIVTRFGGRIEVESEAGRGAAFTVRLPVAPPAAVAKAVRSEEVSHAQP